MRRSVGSILKMVTVDCATSRHRSVVGLVGCVKSKLSRPAVARYLYTSPLFEGRRRWVEQTCDRWFILSALYGLVHPDEVLEPYDQELTSASPRARRAWSDRVLQQLQEALGDLQGLHFEIHAGSPYRDHGLVEGLASRGATVSIPAAGLSLGQQLALYGGGHRDPRNREMDPPSIRPTHARPMPTARQGAMSGPGCKYAPLSAALASSSSPLTVTFADVEYILGVPMPSSARRHRPWWANDTSHTQAISWLSEGWQVQAVDMGAERVTFSKVHR